MGFIGLEDVSKEEIENAFEFSSFSNMRQMEKENKFNVKRLRPGEENNVDSYKVRRGIVGGYKDYLSEEEIDRLNQKMRLLSKNYGYVH